MEEMEHGSDGARACVEVDPVMLLNGAIDSSCLYFPNVAKFPMPTLVQLWPLYKLYNCSI